MKKLITFSLIGYAIFANTNSYGMLARVRPVFAARKAFMQQRFLHTSFPQHFDIINALLLNNESDDRKSDMATISKQLAEQNKLLRHQIALAEKQLQASQINKAYLRAIVKQNDLLFETLAYSCPEDAMNSGKFREKIDHIVIKWINIPSSTPEE